MCFTLFFNSGPKKDVDMGGPNRQLDSVGGSPGHAE